eukprot:6471937-Amphidinium_carterae.1
MPYGAANTLPHARHALHLQLARSHRAFHLGCSFFLMRAPSLTASPFPATCANPELQVHGGDLVILRNSLELSSNPSHLLLTFGSCFGGGPGGRRGCLEVVEVVMDEKAAAPPVPLFSDLAFAVDEATTFCMPTFGFGNTVSTVCPRGAAFCTIRSNSCSPAS